MAHLTRGWTVYTPSHAGWSNMDLKSDLATATNNGTAYTQVYTQNNFWPLHHNDLRKVYGKDTNGVKDSCVAMQQAGTLFAVGATFTDFFGNNYTVSGLRNEAFKVSNLK